MSLFLDFVMGYAFVRGFFSFLLLDLFPCHPMSTEKSTIDEVKKFYNDHSSTVFYVIYGSFTQVEQTILDRGKYIIFYDTPSHRSSIYEPG